MLRISVREPSLDHLMFGGSTIGCLFKEVSENQAENALKAALNHGIRKFDTAPLYGSGLSELRFGSYLPSGTWISTKCGRVIKNKETIQPNDRVEYEISKKLTTQNFHDNFPVAIYTREGILTSLQQSKERLQRNEIDCLRLHDAEDEERFAEATAPGGAVDTMIELRQRGEIKEVSLGMNSADYLLRYVQQYPEGTFDNIMMAGCWNLIDQDGYELLVACQERCIKVTNVGIFASGLLVGSNHYKYDSEFPVEITRKVDQWNELCSEYNVKIIQVAVSFALLPCIVENVAIGMRDAGKVESNVQLFDKTTNDAGIPLGLWKDAQQRGLIRKELVFS